MAAAVANSERKLDRKRASWSVSRENGEKRVIQLEKANENVQHFVEYARDKRTRQQPAKLNRPIQTLHITS